MAERIPNLRKGPALRRIRMRSYKHLGAALDESEGQLKTEWWSCRDPDLETVRDSSDATWQILVTRYDENRVQPPPLLPAAPWGEARSRAAIWGMLALVAVGVTAALVSVAAVWWVIALSIAIALVCSRVLRSRLRDAGTPQKST